MRKKILSPKIYPTDLSLDFQWFVQYWAKGEKLKRLKIRVPNLATSDARLKAANEIITEISLNKRKRKKSAIEVSENIKNTLL